LAQEPLIIFGDGEQTRDYVYVDDVVSANLLASEIDLDSRRQLDDRAFNVGTGIGTSVNGLADVLELIAGTSLGREHRSVRPGELRHSALNADKLRAFGWKPESTLEQGLQETYTFIGREMAGARAT
jgi:UDP-glucose 4-epimerase